MTLTQYTDVLLSIWTIIAAGITWVLLVMAHPFLAITAYHRKGWRWTAAILLFFVTVLLMCITVLLPIALTGWTIRKYAVPYGVRQFEAIKDNIPSYLGLDTLLNNVTALMEYIEQFNELPGLPGTGDVSAAGKNTDPGATGDDAL